MLLSLEDKVNVKFNKYKPTEITTGIIVGIKQIKMRFYAHWWYYYCISPLELEGCEHDEEQWFFEQELK